MITNKDYLIKSLDRFDVDEDMMDIILLKAGIDPESKVDVDACDRAVFGGLSIIVASTTQNISEGGYSISWNMEAVKAYLSSLARELGEEDPFKIVPKIVDRSNIW